MNGRKLAIFLALLISAPLLSVSATMPASAQTEPVAEPKILTLHILANGNMRFDDGPELNLPQLKIELEKMAKETSPANVKIQPEANAPAATISAVVSEFERARDARRAAQAKTP